MFLVLALLGVAQAAPYPSFIDISKTGLSGKSSRVKTSSVAFDAKLSSVGTKLESTCLDHTQLSQCRVFGCPLCDGALYPTAWYFQ